MEQRTTELAAREAAIAKKEAELVEREAAVAKAEKQVEKRKYIIWTGDGAPDQEALKEARRREMADKNTKLNGLKVAARGEDSFEGPVDPATGTKQIIYGPRMKAVKRAEKELEELEALHNKIMRGEVDMKMRDPYDPWCQPLDLVS